jgi:small subunit ribosomal protein S25e
MGGKKKLGLKQMERSQDKRDEEEKEAKKKEKAGAQREKKTASIVHPDAKSDKNVAELKKIGVLTPYAVATRFNMRISAAKDFLKELEHNGKIQLVSGSHNLKIYKVPD